MIMIDIMNSNIETNSLMDNRRIQFRKIQCDEKEHHIRLKEQAEPRRPYKSEIISIERYRAGKTSLNWYVISDKCPASPLWRIYIWARPSESGSYFTEREFRALLTRRDGQEKCSFKTRLFFEKINLSRKYPRNPNFSFRIEKCAFVCSGSFLCVHFLFFRLSFSFFCSHILSYFESSSSSYCVLLKDSKKNVSESNAHSNDEQVHSEWNEIR